MTILAAIGEKERARAVVRLASDLANTYDDTLVALHVVPQENFEEHKVAIESLTGFSVSQDEESAKAFARESAVEIADDINTEQFEARGRVGDVTDEILAEAASLEPRFLVISGRRKSPVGKAVFGNTAQRILLNVECPVVTQLSNQ